MLVNLLTDLKKTEDIVSFNIVSLFNDIIRDVMSDVAVSCYVMSDVAVNYQILTRQ